MKKLLLLTLCIVSCSVFATDEWYESLAGAEAQKLKDTTACGKTYRDLAIAYFSNPDMTYAEYKQAAEVAVEANYKTPHDIGVYDAICICAPLLGKGKFVEDVIADETVHSCTAFIIDYKLGVLRNPKIQAYSATIENKDELYKEAALKEKYSWWWMERLVNKYIDDNILNEDTAMLNVFYAICYDKLNDTKWRPIITKIALNLRRRGVEVQ